MLALALALVVVGAPARARAALCPAPRGADPALATVDAEVRLDYLRRNLRVAAARARAWTWGWSIGYAGLAVGQLALLPLFPEAARVDRYVGTGGALLGLIVILARPLPVMRDSARLEALVAGAGPASDRCALLAEAERLLAQDAHVADRVNQWWSRAGTIGFNVACGLLLSLVFQRYAGAAINVAGGLAIGQLMLNTQPVDTIALQQRYLGAHLDAPPSVSPPWSIAPLVTPNQVGVTAAVSF